MNFTVAENFNHIQALYSRQEKYVMNLKKTFLISFCIVIGVVLVSGGLVYKLGHDLYGSVNYVSDDTVTVEETVPEEETDEGVGEAVSDDELAEIQNSMDTTKDVVTDEDIYNVLLIGVDRQERTWNGNSDCMILVSINKAANRVTMVSLMRDTYVNIPDVGYKKLNAAYAYGAGPLLCETITENFKIEVDKYVAVDFWDLVDIIDIIGGVDLEVTAEEVEVANGYILDMCERLMDIDPTSHYFPEEGGLIHADGVQAVAYARNRYVGNSDFQRTERQRYVLLQLMEEVKQMSVAQMTEKMQSILEYITTNISETEIWSMLTELPDMLEYDFETSRVPYDGMYSTIYVNSQDMLVPDWEETLEILHDFIYGSSEESSTEMTTE
ncbi:MAG: LCP family protein [Lachnospiraceae bacterium]|nr:LCP family protein [Lachnospiraceae bacterium]